MEKLKDLQVDLVYLWVNDKDELWLDKLKKYGQNVNTLDKDATNFCRFYNSEELKYSLRSVEKYMSWINKIYIVTDNQRPEWLKTNEKIEIVDHKDIIPNDKLPLFNSCAIESRIPFIKNLSEYFLYANDDTFVWDYVDKDFFFDNLGRAICRLDKKIRKNKSCRHLYGYTIKRAYEIVSEKCDVPIEASVPHHNIDAYRKSSFLDCINDFQNEFEETLNHRFRDRTDMQRMAVTYYMLAKDTGVAKYIGCNWFDEYIRKVQIDSKSYRLLASKLNKIKKIKSKLICINDCRSTKDSDRKKMIDLLNEKFPEKSAYEKDI